MVRVKIELIQKEEGDYGLYITGPDGSVRMFNARYITDFREGLRENIGRAPLTRAELEAAKGLFGDRSIEVDIEYE